MTLKIQALTAKIFTNPCDALQRLADSHPYAVKIIESIKQAKSFEMQLPLTEIEILFAKKMFDYFSNIDSMLNNNILELSEQYFQQLLTYLKQHDNYQSYAKACDYIKNDFLPKLSLMQSVSEKDLARMQNQYTHLENSTYKQTPIKHCVMSMLNEKTLFLMRNVESYKELNTKATEFLEYSESNIKELEELARQLCELESRIPNNTKLTEELENNSQFEATAFVI